MRHLKIGLAAGAGLLLALLIAMPLAAAAAGRVAIVNGIPGKTAEICVGSKEIASRLKYGKATVRNLGNGTKVLKFRKKSAGKCTGKQLAKKTIVVENGDDLTIVGTRFSPNKVIRFDNESIPIEAIPRVVVRHASDIGTAGFKYADLNDGTPWHEVALDDPWEKGFWGWGFRAAGTPLVWWTHQPPDQKIIAGPYQLVPEEWTRHESILVGTTLGNVRFVRFKITDPG